MLKPKRKNGDMFFWHPENLKNQDIPVSKNYHTKTHLIARLPTAGVFTLKCSGGKLVQARVVVRVWHRSSCPYRQSLKEY